MGNGLAGQRTGLTGERAERYRGAQTPVKMVPERSPRAITDTTVQSGFHRRNDVLAETPGEPRAAAAARGFRLALRSLVRRGNQRFTVMLIPHSERRTYNLQLSVFTLLGAGTLLVVVLCAFLILSTHFTATNERMAAVNRSLAASELALESVGDEVIALQGTMQEFRVLIDQLQRILSSGNLTATTASAVRGAGDLAAFVGQPSALAGESPGVTALRQLSAALDAAMMPLTELNETVAAQQTLLADVPTLWPVRGGGYVSFEFGPQRHPFTGAFYIHRGIDIAMQRGAEIVATANGTVSRIAYERYNLGNVIEIAHRYGFVTRYGHLQRVLIEPGQTVQRGQTIGLMGSTGRSTGPHVHYEVSIGGQLRNPEEFLAVSAITVAALR